jgi:hypothetical protein
LASRADANLHQALDDRPAMPSSRCCNRQAAEPSLPVLSEGHPDPMTETRMKPLLAASLLAFGLATAALPSRRTRSALPPPTSTGSRR